MKRNIKNILLLIIIVYILFTVFGVLEIFMCNKKMQGKSLGIDNDTYIVLNSVLNKKYEYLLYNGKELFKNVYSFNKQELLEKFCKSDKYSEIYNNFIEAKIYKIEKKYIDLYIVYYDEIFENQEATNKQKAIIKYNKLTNRAVICFDTEIEVE